MSDQLPNQHDEAQDQLRRRILGDHRNDMELQFATFDDIWAELSRRCRSWAIVFETDARKPGYHETDYRWVGSPPNLVGLTKYLADTVYATFRSMTDPPIAMLIGRSPPPPEETDDHDGPIETDDSAPA